MRISESPLKKQILKNMKLTRTFHPVGQGAFYTERFYDGDKNVFNMVYDCGSSTKSQYLKNEINDAFKDGTGKAEIDILFVSHFHNDHVNGIQELARQYHVQYLVFSSVLTKDKKPLYCEYLHNICYTQKIDNPANLLIERCFQDGVDYNSQEGNTLYFRDDKATVLLSSDNIDFGKLRNFSRLAWIYSPFCCINKPVNAKTILNDLTTQYPDLKNNLSFGQFFACIRDYFKDKHKIKELRELYKPYYQNDNYYSMTVMSKHTDPKYKDSSCLYTSDFQARNSSYLKQLKKYYSNEWADMATLQVPHHGSRIDNPRDLHNVQGRHCVITYGPNKKLSHPHKDTLMNIALSKSMIHLVNEDQGSKYQTEFNF